MPVMQDKRNATNAQRAAQQETPIYPGSAALRRAIRGNIVSFPSQVPVFCKHHPSDMQWRAVLLFFVHGWRFSDIAARFGVPEHRVFGILNGWSLRALALGFVQIVDVEAFADLWPVDATAHS